MKILSASVALPWGRLFRPPQARRSFDPTRSNLSTTSKKITAEAPLYNSRILNTYLEYIRMKYPDLDVRDLLAYAGVEPHQVKDEGHWFTQEQHDRFHEKLVHLTGYPSISYEAGRYIAASAGAGWFKQYVLVWLGPAAAFTVIGRLASRFTRSADYRSRKISSRTLEIVVTPKPGVEEKPYQCENRRGMFQALFDLFHYRLCRSEHPECMFQGGCACRYVFHWETPPTLFWKRAQGAVGCAFLVAGMALVPYFPRESLVFFPAFLVWFLLNLFIHRLEKKTLTETINRFRRAAEEQLDWIEVNYKNAALIQEIGQAINASLDLDVILEEVLGALERRLDFDRGMILMAEASEKFLRFHRDFGYNEEQRAFLRRTTFPLTPAHGQEPFCRCYLEQKPILVDGIEQSEGKLSPLGRAFFRTLGIRSFLCCPIVYEKQTLGVLWVDQTKKKREWTQSDVSLLMGIANQIGIGINNVRLLEQQKRQFHSMVRVLAASIDARDPLTAGHSEKVTAYALAVAREMGLNDSFCEVLGIAALLHDYGKMGIEDHILKKPGKLNEEEYQKIHAHALKSKAILQQMEFSAAYADIPLWVGAHHEKYDGSGYPDGLKGEEIPLGARIIAVADVFEALTAQRHYRHPMPAEEALKIIRGGAGKDFDPQVVEAFERVFQKAFGQRRGVAPVYDTAGLRLLLQAPFAPLY